MLPSRIVSPLERQVYVIPALLYVCVSDLCYYLAALVRSVPRAGHSVAIMGVQPAEQPGSVETECVSRVRKRIKDGSRLEKPCSVVVKVSVSQSSFTNHSI